MVSKAHGITRPLKPLSCHVHTGNSHISPPAWVSPNLLPAEHFPPAVPSTLKKQHILPWARHLFFPQPAILSPLLSTKLERCGLSP